MKRSCGKRFRRKPALPQRSEVPSTHPFTRRPVQSRSPNPTSFPQLQNLETAIRKTILSLPSTLPRRFSQHPSIHLENVQRSQFKCLWYGVQAPGIRYFARMHVRGRQRKGKARNERKGKERTGQNFTFTRACIATCYFPSPIKATYAHEHERMAVPYPTSQLIDEMKMKNEMNLNYPFLPRPMHA